MGTHNIIVSIYIEKENHPKLSHLPLGDFLQESQEGVRNSRGKVENEQSVFESLKFYCNSLPTELDASASSAVCKDSSSHLDSDSNQSDLNKLVHSSESHFVVSLDTELATQDYYEPDDNSPNNYANCKRAGNNIRRCTGCAD